MKKLFFLFLMLALFSALVTAHADTVIENIEIGQVVVIFNGDVATVTNSGEDEDVCEHDNLYQITEIKTRRLYENYSSHILYHYYIIQCFDCYNFQREVITSETVENHNYVAFEEICNELEYTHIYITRCEGCNDTQSTTTFCRGAHAIPTSIEHDHEDE